VVARIFPFAGRDSYGEAILSRRNRAQELVVIGAERIIRFVEVEDDFPVLREIGF
jgi:hypothetical protein